MSSGLRFNPPPGWPQPPEGWTPPKGWTPDPAWPDPPPGWVLWLGDDADGPGDADVPLPVEADDPGSADHEPAVGPRGLAQRLALLEAENAALRERLEAGGAAEVIVLDDERVLQEVGIYRYHHPLEDAVAYKERLDRLTQRVAELVKAGGAIEKSDLFTYDNSLAKGRRMTSDLGKLMLRAYNAEAENCIRTLRVGNVVTAKKRLEASRTAIARLGAMMEMRVSDAYHALRIEEIELMADFLMKKQEEKEAAREERERLREERKVAAELAAERERLDKERSHLVKTLTTLRDAGDDDADLARRLEDIDEAIERNDYRAANVRAGYVYVISNRGAFGEDVVKIGLTRRLEPLDRVHELGDASVPFRYDVHAMFFSEDAVTLEAELHAHFADRRVNHVNPRREFFFAAPSEIQSVLASKVGNLLEFTEEGEATEYLQSVGHWPERATARTRAT